MINIAIIHYHLRRGGVTRVIMNALAALAGADLNLCVLTGEAQAEDFPVPVKIVDGLGYSNSMSDDPHELVRRMQQAAKDALGTAPDLWHIHNHSLGKNVVAVPAFAELARRGERILFQMHDFAEDGRPDNFRNMSEQIGAVALGQSLYPQASHLHYAVLNDRDFELLHGAGFADDCLHLLPNAVTFEPPKAEPISSLCEGRFYLYPTRAIRRKNMGELLLLAALTDDGDRFGVTLAPENPCEQELYHHWVQLGESLGLPITFDVVGQGEHDFEQLVVSADAMITTSLQEGFGMAFLEPWLAGKPLVGRNLPAVTTMMLNEGLNLDALYATLPIPLAALDTDGLRATWERIYSHSLAAYGQATSEQCGKELFKALTENDCVDFARLPASFQTEVIRQAASDPASWRKILSPDLLKVETDRELITSNQNIAREVYGLQRYGERLHGLYEVVAASAVGQANTLSPQQLLNEFLNPKWFYPLTHSFSLD